jgi:hypothetical protein
MLHRAIITITHETQRNTCYTSGIISAAKILLITDMTLFRDLLVSYQYADESLLEGSAEGMCQISQ